MGLGTLYAPQAQTCLHVPVCRLTALPRRTCNAPSSAASVVSERVITALSPVSMHKPHSNHTSHA